MLQRVGAREVHFSTFCPALPHLMLCCAVQVVSIAKTMRQGPTLGQGESTTRQQTLLPLLLVVVASRTVLVLPAPHTL